MKEMCVTRTLLWYLDAGMATHLFLLKTVIAYVEFLEENAFYAHATYPYIIEIMRP